MVFGQSIQSFQTRVRAWVVSCFGSKISDDKLERNFRFLEEALELVQSLNMTKEECIELVEYVYSRPVGEPSQEVGGVMVTLAALVSANDISLDQASERELARICDPEIMNRIREKQKNKPAVGAKPGVYPERKPMGVQHG